MECADANAYWAVRNPRTGTMRPRVEAIVPASHLQRSLRDPQSLPRAMMAGAAVLTATIRRKLSASIVVLHLQVQRVPKRSVARRTVLPSVVPSIAASVVASIALSIGQSTSRRLTMAMVVR